MRKAGRLAAEILDALVPHVVPGVTTEELDDIVRQMTLRGGGVSQLWYGAGVGSSHSRPCAPSHGRAGAFSPERTAFQTT